MFIKPIIFTKSSYSVEQLNSLYSFYRKTWVDTFEELDSDHSDIEDDFFRFDIKLGFFKGDTPVAFHGYQYFDLSLEGHRKHTYFRRLPPTLVDQLKDMGIKKLVTLEYMCIDHNYRKIEGFRLGELLGGFSTQFFDHNGVDAVITVTRNNRGVNRMCKMYGAKPLYENLQLHNVAVDIMLFRPGEITGNPKKETQNQIEFLLDNVFISKNDQISKVV